MPNRGLVRDIAFGFAFLAVLLSGIYGLTELVNEHRRSADAAQYAANEKAVTNDQVSGCQALPPKDALICVSKAFNANRDANRAEEDVSAQKYMAKAAFWAWVAAWFQSLVAIGGIYFVARTVSQTGEALRLTNRQLLIENRPWLKITSVTREAWEDGEGRDGYSLVVFVKNVGSGHALYAQTSAVVARSIFVTIGNGASGKFAYESVARATMDWGNVGVFASDEAKLHNFDCDGLECSQNVIVCVTYRSAISPIDVHHAACVVYFSNGSDNGMISSGSLSIG